MRKLSEIKGEEAIEVLAEIIEPLVSVFSDDEVQEIIRNKKPYVMAVKPALKRHKKEILHVLATIDGVSDEDFAPTIIELPAMLIGILNDPETQAIMQSLFTSGSAESTSFGSPSENIEA